MKIGSRLNKVSISTVTTVPIRMATAGRVGVREIKKAKGAEVSIVKHEITPRASVRVLEPAVEAPAPAPAPAPVSAPVSEAEEGLTSPW